MAGIIRRRKLSPKSDSADTTLIRPGDYNDYLKVEGGSDGNLLARDTSDSLYGTAWTDTPVVQAVRFLLSAPASPTEGDVWFEIAGTSPTRTLTLYVRDTSTTRSVVLATF